MVSFYPLSIRNSHLILLILKIGNPWIATVSCALYRSNLAGLEVLVNTQADTLHGMEYANFNGSAFSRRHFTIGIVQVVRVLT